jgi:hypothetical protein
MVQGKMHICIYVYTHTHTHTHTYTEFLLFAAVILCKVTINTQLANKQSLLLGENQSNVYSPPQSDVDFKTTKLTIFKEIKVTPEHICKAEATLQKE